jgi:hypothetical protein
MACSGRLRFGAYVRSQTQLAEVLEANGVRVAFLTPQSIEDKRPDPDKDVRKKPPSSWRQSFRI